MRIGIDARELSGRVTGVGRYLAGLLREWSADDDARQHDFVLYASDDLPLAIDMRRFRIRLVGGRPGTWWEQTRLPRAAARDALDVFFAPAYTAPLLSTTPTVVTIHDLSYEAHPEWFRLREGARRRLVTRRSAHRAAAIVAVSRFTRDEVVERLNIPADRVHVIPQGIDPPVLEEVVSRSPTILYVGSIFNRRHVPDLIAAFARLVQRRPEARLEIVGDNRSYPAEDPARAIDACGVGDRAVYRRYVGDDTLRLLYGSASAFAFVSEYEGLGTTPLEALAASLPPVVADTAVSRETIGDAALYVTPGNVSMLADALEQVLFDETVRRRILAAAPATLAKYDWRRAARETLALLVASGA